MVGFRVKYALWLPARVTYRWAESLDTCSGSTSCLDKTNEHGSCNTATNANKVDVVTLSASRAPVTTTLRKEHNPIGKKEPKLGTTTWSEVHMNE